MEKIYSVFEGFLFVVPEVESADCESRLLHEDDEKSAQASVHVHRNRVLQHRRGIIPVLRIQIRDPVRFWPLDPGSGISFFPNPGSRIPNPYF